MLKDFESLCLDKNGECKIKSSSIPDPREYNLTEDFIYVDQEWGSLFYKYIGKMYKAEATQKCSQYGDAVHLPIPRFSDENEFYRNHFGHEDLWLDISYDPENGGFKSLSGHSFTDRIQTVSGILEIKSYAWINASTKLHSTGLVMPEEWGQENPGNNPGVPEVYMRDGQWRLIEDYYELDSVCIYNIIPDDKCSKCADEDFCRFTDSTKQETECVCPEMKDGKFCKTNRCKHCQNGGLCELNDQTNEYDCICRHPYQGPKCESSKNSYLFESVHLKNRFRGESIQFNE